jgi:phosphoribosylaminoimidazolecarboxamide formyltransferase/IMP cyclohydrolase
LRVRRALLSVADKSGLVEFARALHGLEVELISTGGTARALHGAAVPVQEVSALTGFPELLDGRVKTLHPKVHAALLARRDKPYHMDQLDLHKIRPIDMVVCNLYPFDATVARGAPHEEVIENIDIGGVTLLRSAAKNGAQVAVVTSPGEYDALAQEMRESGGELGAATLERLALDAFAVTARYDASIVDYLAGRQAGGSAFPPFLSITGTKAMDLRYGENPQQKAALYATPHVREASLVGATIHQGKSLSFNNMLDMDSALGLLKEFNGDIAVVVLKHNTPCGVGRGDSAAQAYERALSTDPLSAYGGIVGCTVEVDEALATALTQSFKEAIIAPAFSSRALEVLSSKPNMRAVEVPNWAAAPDPREWDLKKVVGGVLVQERNLHADGAHHKVVTKRKPTDEETRAMRFALRIAKHMKSNAIVFAREFETVGLGAGQMSRVDAVKVAAMKSVKPSKGAVIGSDAFFPFRDGVDEAAKAGIAAIVQPGGSIRDQEVIDAADEHGMAMVFTGVRHLRH